MNDKSKIVLMYHDVYSLSPNESGIKENGASMYKIQYHIFEEHVKSVADYLKDNNLSNDIIQFSFDDGGESFYTLIAPLLEKYGFKGIFFVIAHYIGKPSFLNQDQIIDLNKRGHLIASHSYSHPVSIAALKYTDIIHEWSASRKMLEDILGEKIVIASVPNSICSRNVFKAAAEAGIKTLYTSEPTMAVKQREGIDAVGRFVIYSNTTSGELMQIITSPFQRRKMKLRYDLLDIAHTMLGANYDRIKNFFLKENI